jgi:hypothetical protein
MPYSEVVPPEEAHSSAEPSPVAKQTHADASDEASVSNDVATANAARVRGAGALGGRLFHQISSDPKEKECGAGATR